MQQNAKYRRTQYLVAKKIQLKYVGLILLLVMLTAIMCSYVVYYTMMVTMGDKLANVYPQGRLISVISTVNFRILLSMLLVSPLVIAIGIYASHKIAGPVYRIEGFLNSMSEGDFSAPITLRRDDELISLANGINKVVDSVNATMKREKAELDKISTSMERLRKLAESKPVDNTALDIALERLSESLIAVQREVEKYKV